MKKKLLSQLIGQYRNRHQRDPVEIVLHPVALAALALRKSVAPVWSGIPVACREVKPSDQTDSRRLGVTVKEGALVGFDL